jgi:hypothetical protein
LRKPKKRPLVEYEPRLKLAPRKYDDGVGKIYLGQDKWHSQSIVKTTMNFLVSQKVVELAERLVSCEEGL